jgi:BirA family biotin operon repressor/biotin-[acetyl-CoA-carboxylase] ligase
MEVSRVLARNGAPHGTVISADFQEEGRGRIRERRWEMEKGNALAFTVLLRFPAGIPAALTLRTGLAAALAIEDFAPALAGRALIKWPNDILLPVHGPDGGQTAFLKTAGILAEAEGGSVHIGIGVNLSTGDRHILPGKATSIGLAAGAQYKEGDRHILLERILLRLHDEIEPCTGAAQNWRERIEARLYKKGEQVCFAKGEANSGNLVTGVLAGIGTDGELLIKPQGETGTLAFTAGEIRMGTGDQGLGIIE